MQLDGTWINQNGSTVDLESGPSGRLTGHYCSRKGRAASGKRYPLFGQRNGDVLTFYVSWQDADDNLAAITSFCGRIGRDAEGRDIIHTVWVLARQWEDAERSHPTGTWNAFLTNSDVFHRAE